MEEQNELQPIYVDLASESEDPHVTIIESLCISCLKQGSTRLLMTRIPHFREVILTSFDCPHCGNNNTGIQPGGVQDYGVRYELTVKDIDDLSRQVVKSDNAIVSVPEVQLEIPADGKKGEITTGEGILQRTIEGLTQDQPARREIHPELAEQIDNFIAKLSGLLMVNEPFTIVVDDISGNSFVENPSAPKVDPQLQKKNYKRSNEQNAALGLQDPNEALETLSEKEEEEEDQIEKKEEDEDNKEEDEDNKEEDENLKNEVLTFATLCDKCSRPVDTNMKVTQIPYFQEVIIMATHCEGCGNRTNEVKSGSGIQDKGKKLSLKITDPTDMARDVLKSDTCNVEIPDLELHIGAGILGGKFTTLEGLLLNIHDDLAGNPFLAGDATNEKQKEYLEKLLDDIKEVVDGTRKVTFILDDPAGNSYIQNVYAPDDDPELTVEEYERSYEQNEDLGLNQMKTENYGELTDPETVS